MACGARAADAAALTCMHARQGVSAFLERTNWAKACGGTARPLLPGALLEVVVTAPPKQARLRVLQGSGVDRPPPSAQSPRPASVEGAALASAWRRATCRAGSEGVAQCAGHAERKRAGFSTRDDLGLCVLPLNPGWRCCAGAAGAGLMCNAQKTLWCCC